MIEHLGMSGIPMTDELVSKQGPYVEEFINLYTEEICTFAANKILYLLPGEFAMTDAKSFEAIGCSGMEQSIVIIMINRTVSECVAVANVPYGVRRETVDKICAEMCFEIVGSHKSTRRGFPSVDVYLIGGVDTEELLDIVLTSLSESPYRYSIKLSCCGRLNDCSHFKVDNIKEHETVVNAICVDLQKKTVLPVSGFNTQQRGPFLNMRLAKLYFQTPEDWIAANMCNVLNAGKFIFHPTRLRVPDNQSLCIMLWQSFNTPLELWSSYYDFEDDPEFNVDSNALAEFSADWRIAALQILRIKDADPNICSSFMCDSRYATLHQKDSVVIELDQGITRGNPLALFSEYKRLV